MTSRENDQQTLLSPVQSRAARALLGWSQSDLAKHASVGVSTVADFERGQRSPVPNNLEAMRRALEKAGITVLPGGVVAGPAPASMRLRSKVPAGNLRPARWVNESDLSQWADRRDGQDTLPELVRRLIIAEQGYLPDLRFPSGDSVAMHGWDGLSQAPVQSEHVPAGWSGWEIGADRNPTQKANRTYADRLKSAIPIDRARSTFVFVTPRRWARKDAWLSERRAEKEWADVSAFDAVDLVQWLERFPALGLWLRGQIYRQRLEGVQDLREAWREWSVATKLPLTENLVLCGRDDEAARLWRWLHGEPAILAVEAEAPGEAVAFLAAAVGQLPASYRDFYDGKCVVVANPEVARSLADVPTHLIIVLEQPEPGVAARLVEKGHHVFLPFGMAGARGDAMPLPRPSRYELEACLVEASYSENEAKSYAHDCARSLTILRRLVPAASGYRFPEWAVPERGRDLLPVLFAGAWDERADADRECLVRLSDISYENFVGRLSGLLRQSDSPLRKAGTIWKIASPRDAWFRLAPYVTSQDLDRFELLAQEVLTTVDPRFAMAGDERVYAASGSELPRHSSYLRTGVCETLILLGAFGQQAVAVPDADRRSAKVVRYLLWGAGEERWWSLSDQLRELAEAAPEMFLECVENGLAGSDPPVMGLFREDGGGFFGRSYHTELLWALETLAWSADHLGPVTEILATLSALDPGGRLSNRPSRSLRQIYLLWHPQTNVELDDRLKVLKRLRKTQPDAAWKLFLELYPKNHDTSQNNPLPRWRDFSVDNPEVVTRRSIFRGAEQLGTWLLEDVGTDARRWVALTERCADLSPAHRKEFLTRCESLADVLENAADRARIQDAIRQLVNRHRKYGQPSWILPEEDLQALEKAYDALAPKGLVEKSAWLFASEDAALIAPEGHDWKENIAASRRARGEALKQLMAAAGIAGVKELAGAARMPALVGEAFADAADRQVVDDELENFVRSPVANEQALSRGIIWACYATQREPWADRLIEGALEQNWGADTVARILLALPASEHFLRRASEIGGEAADQYWKNVSVFLLPDDADSADWVVEQLLNYGRSHGAITLAGHQPDRLPDELLVKILEEAAKSDKQEPDGSSMFRYYVERIFQRLDKSEKVGTDRLAQLEWMYLKVLDDSARPPVTLHKQLAASPKFFLEVLSTIYRGNSEEPGRIEEEDREKKAALASHAWTLLHSWHLLPGAKGEGAVDGAALGNWVAAARRLCRDADRVEIGDQQIGQMLAWAPGDADGTWPCEPVRDVIEVTRSRDLETGLYIGVKNKRGVTSRGMLDGGDQERDLARRYREHSEAARFEWPRTSAVLDRIADSYEAEAKEHDDDVERRQW